METSGRTFVCSVLFLDIAGYSEKPVAEQLEIKEALNEVLAAALEQVAPRDRVFVDTGDGAAIAFTGAPEDALFTAIAVRDAAPAKSLRLGINLGPVRMMKDLSGKANIIGDGINAAQRVMSFAAPGQLMVSRSFYEVVSCLAEDYRKLFHYEGARTDKHVREHEVYSVGTDSMPARRQEGSAYRRLLRGMTSRPVMAAAAAAVLTAAAASVFLMRAPEVTPSAPVVSAELPQAKAVASTPLPKKAAAKPVEAPKPAAAKAVASPKSARIEFAVAPWGEVWVDGKRRGASPPLRVLNVPPGRHTVEIRNTTFPPHVQKVDLKPGESLALRYKFTN